MVSQWEEQLILQALTLLEQLAADVRELKEHLVPAPKPVHEPTCKLFPDPFDERDPVGLCTCGAVPAQGKSL